MSTTVANFDIAGAADRIVTFANELIASQSARQAEFNVHDRDRSTSYLDRLEGYVGVISEPANPLDLPKTHPTAYPVNDFPADEQDLIQMQLSLNLRGVVSQRLLQRKDGGGRVPAIEVLIGTPIVSKLILQGKTVELNQAIQNQEKGMQTFLQSLVALIKEDVVTLEEAMNNTEHPLALQRNITGGYSDGDRAGLVGF